MGWPTIPTAMIATDSVRISRVTWAKGPISDRRVSYGTPSDPVPCVVEEASAGETSVHSSEDMYVKYTVTFTDYPALKLRDRLTWIWGGGIGTDKTLTVVAFVPIGDATSRTWKAYCEEHTG